MTKSHKILGKTWTFRLLDKKAYKSKKSRRNSLAVTYFHKRRIDFSPSGVDIETVIHEIVHAYMYEMCLHSCNELTTADMGEVYAELLSKRGKELLALGDKVLRELKGGSK